MGLEVHVELNTNSKMFCGCPTEFGAEPNTQVCPTCLGLPGRDAGGQPDRGRVGHAHRPRAQLRDRRVVPVRPEELLLPGHAEELPDLAVRRADRLRRLHGRRRADRGRRHEVVRVEIERAHMEEDTGKSLHVGGATGRIHGADYSLVDYNRAGIPLIEIVTRPIMGTREKAPAVAKAYVAQLRELIVALGVSDARMDQGSIRADVNLSLAPDGRRRPRHPHRDQERQLAALGRAGRALRDAAARRHPRRRAGRSSRRPGTGTRTPASPPAVARSPTPRTTATSPSPTSSRSRRAASGSTSSAARCPRTRPSSAARLQSEWGFSDLEMRDTIGAGAFGLVEETIAAGATPQIARKWWLSELARRANDTGTDIADARRHAGRRRRRAEARSTPARSTTSWPVRSSRACTPARARPRRSWPPAASRSCPTTVRSSAAVDNAIAANPDVADKIRDGKVAAAGALIGAVMKEMRGQADAGPGARADPGEADLTTPTGPGPVWADER